MGISKVRKFSFFTSVIFVMSSYLYISCSSFNNGNDNKDLIVKNTDGNKKIDFDILLPEYGSVFEPILTIEYTNKKTDSRLKFKYEIKNNLGVITSKIVDIKITKENSYLKNILYKELSINLGKFISPLAGMYTLEISDINKDGNVVAIALQNNIKTNTK